MWRARRCFGCGWGSLVTCSMERSLSSRSFSGGRRWRSLTRSLKSFVSVSSCCCFTLRLHDFWSLYWVFRFTCPWLRASFPKFRSFPKNWACSFPRTCFSWHVPSTPHLHRPPIFPDPSPWASEYRSQDSSDQACYKSSWSNPWKSPATVRDTESDH